MEPATGAGTEFETVVVGSGFSGLAAAAGLLRAGHGSFVVLERSGEVGGTWRDNSYPGCACDVPSHLYSFSFAPNPDWSATYSPQPEIQAYLQRVAVTTGVRDQVRFGSEMRSSAWDPSAARWRIETDRGRLSARFLVVAAGPLSEPSIPAVPGLADFRGRVFHSARWDHDYDLEGKRVAVVGTGASAIQFVPEIQPRVSKLTVFQRTPAWVLPRRSRPLTRLERALYRRFPIAQRAMREAIFWGRELYAIPLLRAGLARLTTRLAGAHLRRQVRDPELRAKLTPEYAPGCKRVLISNHWYRALDRDNVDIVTGGLSRVTEHGVVGSDGIEREVDAIIFGTGFQVTEFPVAGRIRDARGRSLKAAWSQGAAAHRGTTVAGFPNLFLMLGPNTGLGHTSVVIMAEAQVAYILQAIAHAGPSAAVEVLDRAQDAWQVRLQHRLAGTVWNAGGCRSWYLDGSGRNSTLWPDFSFRFQRALARFDAASYRRLEPAPQKAAA